MKNTHRNNINYFRMGDGMRILGAGLLIAGLLFLWLGFGWLTWILMLLFIPTGLGLFLYSSVVRASDADIASEIEKRMDGLVFYPDEDPVLCKKVLKNTPPYVAEGYVLREGVMLRRDKTSRLRSSEYSKAIIHILSDRLYILHRRISLVEDTTVNLTYDVPYTSVEKVQILRDRATLSFHNSTYPTPVTLFLLKHEGGTVTFPINDDIEADHLVERIQKQIQRAAEESNENQK